MQARIYLIALVLPWMLAFSGCNSSAGKEERISADVVSNSNSASGSERSGDLPSMKFNEVEHDFGKVIQGESVTCEFKFTNTGKTDLIIVDVNTSCGCTVPSFPKTPIHAGDEGVIKVSFNSAGKHGAQTKSVLVVANTQPNTTMLRIKANIVGPNAD
jgi:hypothetical protein